MGSVNRVLNQREQINAWLAGWRALEEREAKLEAAVRTLTKRSVELDDAVEGLRKTITELRADFMRHERLSHELHETTRAGVLTIVSEVRWHRILLLVLGVAALAAWVLR